jgi:hypothetical protein
MTTLYAFLAGVCVLLIALNAWRRRRDRRFDTSLSREWYRGLRTWDAPR